MPKTKKEQRAREKRARQRARAARPPRVSTKAGTWPDPHGSTPVVFDATIPDHFALAVGLELLRARYEKCGAYFPSQARDELRRVSAAMPALQDALTAPWLLD